MFWCQSSMAYSVEAETRINKILSILHYKTLVTLYTLQHTQTTGVYIYITMHFYRTFLLNCKSTSCTFQSNQQ